jgi:hypothetical protein
MLTSIFLLRIGCQKEQRGHSQHKRSITYKNILRVIKVKILIAFFVRRRDLSFRMRSGVLALFCSMCLVGADSPRVDCALSLIFSDLWKASAYGQDPNSVERAAWILKTDTGYATVRWPCSHERNREVWHGPLPGHAIAQAHTHTVKVDPQPSRNDIQLSQRFRIPLYTISQRGIWMVTSDGRIQQVADENWYHRARSTVPQRSIGSREASFHMMFFF